MINKGFNFESKDKNYLAKYFYYGSKLGMWVLTYPKSFRTFRYMMRKWNNFLLIDFAGYFNKLIKGNKLELNLYRNIYNYKYKKNILNLSMYGFKRKKKDAHYFIIRYINLNLQEQVRNYLNGRGFGCHL